MKIGIDFETYSDVDLPVHGLDNYVRGEDFTPLICSVSMPDRGEYTYDFILDPGSLHRFIDDMQQLIADPDVTFVAHNAGFERAVNRYLGLDIADRIIDSAVYARMAGVGEKLEVASRQLTDTAKLEVGASLIQIFCIPNEWNRYKAPSIHRVMERSEEWIQFTRYCEIDAKAGREIVEAVEELFAQFGVREIIERENDFELVTWHMNDVGWHVDKPLVEAMNNRAWANTEIEKRMFALETGELINFNSHVQLKRYCEKRGVKVKSLDKYRLPVLLEKIEKKLLEIEATQDAPRDMEQWVNLREVHALLQCKQEIGGSSLSKLTRILELMGPDGQLRDQYVHVGAGQTFRTSGRGVQMQNLKKLDGNIRDMSTVYDYKTPWSNVDMAGQLRQVFTASHPDGKLFVGDFSAVESRGLAYLAGEEWKLDAYRQGLDVYKVLVTRFKGYENLTVDDVTPEMRPRGKYSELSCGYQASAVAVQEFMFRLGFHISEEEAAQNVTDWRYANPAIVQFWGELDNILKAAVALKQPQTMTTAYGQVIKITPFWLPSIQEQHPGAVSLMVQLFDKGRVILARVVHGCYFQGQALCYYKPAERLSAGRLWDPINHTATQKQGREIKNTIFGGKLTGIIVQSLCRELFFDSMKALHDFIKHQEIPNAVIVGQFHDEIVVDWWPSEEDGAVTEEDLKNIMEGHMSWSRLDGFPLTAEIKSDFRYIK